MYPGPSPCNAKLLGVSYMNQVCNVIVRLQVCKLRGRGLVPALYLGQHLKIPDMLECSLVDCLYALFVTQQALKRLDCSLNSELMALTKGSLSRQNKVRQGRTCKTSEGGTSVSNLLPLLLVSDRPKYSQLNTSRPGIIDDREKREISHTQLSFCCSSSARSLNRKPRSHLIGSEEVLEVLEAVLGLLEVVEFVLAALDASWTGETGLRQAVARLKEDPERQGELDGYICLYPSIRFRPDLRTVSRGGVYIPRNISLHSPPAPIAVSRDARKRK